MIMVVELHEIEVQCFYLYDDSNNYDVTLMMVMIIVFMLVMILMLIAII